MDEIKTINLPNCALCSFPFSSTGYSLFKNIKLPLLLHCGHSSCENCLIKELNNKKEVQCKICDTISTVSDSYNPGDLSKEFPINHYLAGMWYLKIVSNSSDLDSMIKFSKPRYKKKKLKSAIACHECSEKSAEYHCNQCEVPYCSSCYKLIHSFAKAFRSHTNVSIYESFYNFDLDKPVSCLTHNSYKLEYFCSSCHAPICSHCIVESHNGHTVNKLEEVEIDCEEDFIQNYLKVTNLLNRMVASQKDAESILQNDTDIVEIKKTEEEISNYFVLLHGKLALVENQIHKKLSTASTRSILEEIICSIKGYIEDAETLLASTRTLLLSDTNVGKKCIAVTENLKSRLNLPSYFIQSNDWKEPRFHADQDFLKTLEKHCKLEFSTNPRYQLVNKENLPYGYHFQPVKELTKEEIVALLRKPYLKLDASSVDDSDRPASPSVGSEKSYSSQTRDHPSQALCYADELTIGCSITARISHLISPSLFYVQRECAQKKLLDFQASLRPSQVHRSKPPNRTEKGKVYLALYGEDKKWYRARIINILDQITYEVFYVDFGNSEILDRSRIRMVPKSSLNMPFMAYRCQLADCVPRFGDDWDPRAVSLMTEIIDNDFVTITVISKTLLTYIVDLYKVTENSFTNLRESLSFHELASMTSMFNQTTDITVRQNLNPPPRKEYPVGELIKIHVSHVNSPHEFYVQDLAYSRKLIQLSEDLQRAYNIINSNKNAIYDPKKGMLVAARYSKDSKWYRANIIECLEGKQVKVFYIDFGNEEIALWENIKLLSSRFVNFSPQAIRCGLCDVCPQDEGDNWDEDSCLKFHGLIFNKIFKIVVAGLEKGLLTCVMYESTEQFDICINAFITKELCLATGIGAYSTTVRYIKKSSTAIHGDNLQPEVSVEKKKVKNKMMKTSRNVEGHTPQHFVKLPDGGVRTQVSVKTIVNPGEFYVLPCCFEDRMKKLKYSLQEFYEKKKVTDDIKWVVDDRCVVNLDNSWHRAIVSDIISNGQLKVNFVDEGCERTVESNIVFIMDSSFANIPDGVVKCHLGGLEPTLDTWSALSKSELEEFVNNKKHNLYISQLGKIKDSSLPVELFSRIPIDVGPTEPIKDDWKSLNHYLRFIGLAKADGIIQWDSDGKVISISNEDDDNDISHLEELIKDSLNLNEEASATSTSDVKTTNDNDELTIVKEAWLPPEPLPSLEFVAAPTYVDENCIIYLHDFHRSEKLLEEISSALCTKYDNSLPHLYDATIEPGEICIAKYHLDNKWYRAVLLEKFTETNEFKIQFVDYGNIETCKLAEIRKVTVTQHIPIQCYKCKFHRLVPGDPSGNWIPRHIEIIQYTIVDKHCQVQLIEIPDSDIYGIDSLILSDGVNYEKVMVQKNFAAYKRSALYKNQLDQNLSPAEAKNIMDLINTPVLEPEPIKVNEKGHPLIHWSSILESLSPKEMPHFKYRPLEIPPVVKFMIVEVSAFLSPTDVILHIEDVDDDPVVLKMLEGFKKISKQMEMEGPSQPLLMPPFKYQPCCAIFSVDKKWYRGFALAEYPNNMILVQFVDYGNVELVPALWVRELKEEWGYLQAQSLLASLHNVEVAKDLENNAVMQPLQDCLSAGPVKAEIIERSPCLQVELYVDEKLAYQNLLDLKVFKFINR